MSLVVKSDLAPKLIYNNIYKNNNHYVEIYLQLNKDKNCCFMCICIQYPLTPINLSKNWNKVVYFLKYYLQILLNNKCKFILNNSIKIVLDSDILSFADDDINNYFMELPSDGQSIAKTFKCCLKIKKVLFNLIDSKIIIKNIYNKSKEYTNIMKVSITKVNIFFKLIVLKLKIKFFLENVFYTI